MSPVVIRGEVLADALGSTSRDGIAELRFEARVGAYGGAQRGQADAELVVLACKVYGTGNAAAAARDARVRQLRRGVRVVIAGRGHIRGRRLVVLADDITTPDVFDPRLHAAGTN